LLDAAENLVSMPAGELVQLPGEKKRFDELHKSTYTTVG